MSQQTHSTSAPSRVRGLGIAAFLSFGVNLAVVGALLWPGLVPDEHRRAFRLADAALTWVIGALLVVMLVRLATALKGRDETRERQQMLFDAMPTGLALWGPDDRLQIFNADFARLYAPLSDRVAPGVSFDALMRTAVERGLVPEAVGHEQDWLARRLEQHRNPGPPIVRRMADGRWRRIVEQRLPDGSVLGHSVDITDIVVQGEALEAARHEAEQTRQRLEDAFEAMPACLELYDAADRLVLTNQAMREVYPQLVDLESQRPTFEQLVRINQARGGLAIEPAAFETWLAERMAQRKAGTPPTLSQVRGRWYRRHERPTREGGIIGIRIDVTELEQARAAEARATERLQDAIEALPAGFELYDADDRLLMVNSTLKAMYPRVADLLDQGLRFADLVRANWQRGGLVVPDGDFERWLVDRLAQRGAGGPPGVHELREGLWVRTYERHTREGGLVGVRIDVTELMLRDRDLARLNRELDAANAELRRQAETDPLTGAANRRRFERELAAAMASGAPLALLMLDIDHFKRFNDRHGHPAGDACLRRVAAVLTAVLRNPDDLVARLGGEEFAVLLPGEDAAGGLATAQRCLDLLAEAAIAHGDSPLGPNLSCSIGVATRAALREPASADALIAAADAALYAAKAAGRSRAMLFSGAAA